MSEESLSQNQVESLLKAMEGVDMAAVAPAESAAAATTTATPNEPSRPSTPKPPFSPNMRVMAYDFKRPERVGKDQMRAMQSLHEAIARNFGASVSGMLRTMIETKLLSVDQLTYSEFVFSLDNPSCFNVVRADPLEGHWIFDIAPPLAYAVIDRMLGGDPVPGDAIRRPLTEIETRLMARVVHLFLEQLKIAWRNIIDLEFTIDRTESNPQLVQVVPPNEVVILIGFEMVLGKNRGMMNLCIPFNTIERFNAQLSRNGWVGYGKMAPTEDSRSRIKRSVDAAPVEIVVTLARSSIRTRDLLELAVGDIIATEKEVDSPLELSIQEIPKFNARAGAFKGKKAVRIESLIERPKPLPHPAPPAD